MGLVWRLSNADSVDFNEGYALIESLASNHFHILHETEAHFIFSDAFQDGK